MVDLSGNKFEDDGAVALAASFRQNTPIQKLDLSRNRRIGPKGQYAISDAIKANTSLHNLDLSFNEIGDESAAAIGMALGQNASIREIDVGDVGAVSLAASLRQNTSIRMLRLFNNNIGADSVVAFAATKLIDSKALRVQKTVWSERPLRYWRCHRGKHFAP